MKTKSLTLTYLFSDVCFVLISLCWGKVDQKQAPQFVLFAKRVGREIAIFCSQKEYRFLPQVVHKYIL
jgi:hypothetical protein